MNRLDLPVWRCGDFRPVHAESADAAARIFANRQARLDYGTRRGRVHGVRLEGCTFDRRDYTFQAFIGRANGRGLTEGHNVWLFVHRVGAPQEAPSEGHEQRPPD